MRGTSTPTAALASFAFAALVTAACTTLSGLEALAPAPRGIELAIVDARCSQTSSGSCSSSLGGTSITSVPSLAYVAVGLGGGATPQTTGADVVVTFTPQ